MKITELLKIRQKYNLSYRDTLVYGLIAEVGNLPNTEYNKILGLEHDYAMALPIATLERKGLIKRHMNGQKRLNITLCNQNSQCV